MMNDILRIMLIGSLFLMIYSDGSAFDLMEDFQNNTFTNSQKLRFDLTNRWRPRRFNKNKERNLLGARDSLHTLKHNGIERIYQLHLPTQYNASKAWPLVINLHGGGGSWKSAKRSPQMDQTADIHGFLVVYPNAHQSRDGGKRWNMGSRPNAPEKEGIADDVDFIRQMIRELEGKFSIDQNRIYATGISNGGMMTYRLACELSDQIAAVATVATALAFEPCRPSRPTPLIHFHGTADPLITYDGGPSPNQIPKSMRNDGHQFKSVGYYIKHLLQQNQCPVQGKESFRKGQATCVTYAPCQNLSEIVSCTIQGGGHTWPGGIYEVDRRWYKKLVGPISQDINANEEMWRFFQKHPLKPR